MTTNERLDTIEEMLSGLGKKLDTRFAAIDVRLAALNAQGLDLDSRIDDYAIEEPEDGDDESEIIEAFKGGDDE